MKCNACGGLHKVTECPAKIAGNLYCSHHPTLKTSHSTSACRNPGGSGGNGGNGGSRANRGRGAARGARGARGAKGRGKGRGRGRGGSRDSSTNGDGNVNLVEVTTEAVMAVQMEVGDGPNSALLRAKSPTDTTIFSDLEEELECPRCDNMMGPCMIDHSEDEETVYSMYLEGPDTMYEGDIIYLSYKI